MSTERWALARNVLAFAVGFVLAPVAYAADPDILFAQARETGGAWEIQIQFNTSLSAAKTCGPADCTVFDVMNGTTVPIAGDGQPRFDVLILRLAAALSPGSTYHVFVRNLDFSGVTPATPPTHVAAVDHNVTMPPSGPGPAPHQTAGPFARFFHLKEADGRDDSNLYFSGQSTHSRGKEFVGTYDAKIDLGKRYQFWGRTHLIGPMLDLKGGNDPNGDPDSLNLGIKWDFPLVQKPCPAFLTAIRWANNPKLESTQDFTNKNFIFDSAFRLVLKPWGGGSYRAVRAHMRPFAGVEVGKNLRGTIKEVEGRSIARVKVGGFFYLVFPVHAAALEDLTFETDYERRWPLHPEIALDTDSDTKVFVADHIGTKPRNYVKETLGIDITKFFGFTVVYEYGSLPPKFHLLDSKFTLGVTLKAAFPRPGS